MKSLSWTSQFFFFVSLLAGLPDITAAQTGNTPLLELTAPAAGSTPSQGALLSVRWRDHRAAPNSLYLYLRDAVGGAEREIGSNLQSAPLAAESSFDWFTPTDVSPGNYAVVLRSFDRAQEASSAPLTLLPAVAVPGAIRVLNPPRWAGELPTLADGERVSVTWDFPTGKPEAVSLVLDVYADHRYAGSKTLATGEARLKLPRNSGEPRQSTGLWPAFWMLPVSPGPPECGAYEHDILEMFGQPFRAYMTVHWPDCNGQFSQHGAFFDQVDPPDFTDDFHVFGFEWEADALTWYIDGVVRKRYTDASHIFQGGPMYVNLNLAIGGFAGDANAITAPVEMAIDYVRIWQR